MKPNWRFLRLVAYFYAGTCIVGLPLMLLYGSAEALRATTAAAIVSVVYLLVGYFSIEYSFDKDNITFLKFVMGGIGIRLFATATLVFLMIRYLSFQAFSLVVSLLYFYILNLGLEIYFLETKVKIHR